jgi:hypothetical protein
MSLLSENRRLLAFGALSGVLSYFGTLLLDAFPGWVRVSRGAGTYLPGVFFGGLVMAMNVPEGSRRSLRQAACMAASALIYYLAVKLAAYLTLGVRIQEMAACAFAGVLGTLAVGAAARFIVPSDISPNQMLKAVIVGGFGGAVLGVSGSFRLPDALESFFLILGFVTWQTGVGFVFFQSKGQEPGEAA